MPKYKFNIGDKVKIVNYGHNSSIGDLMPELIGREAIVRDCTTTQGFNKYALRGIRKKSSWYYEDQLEMINPNPNTI
tara:strand:- start:630 stop:860 length:231 start_codon:yes stop_codon:yes gene_type:complete